MIQPIQIMGMFIVPFITGYLNVQANKYLLEKNDDILHCVILHAISGYFGLVSRKMLYNDTIKKLKDDIIMRFNMSNIKCGIVLPGKNIKKIDEILNDKHKLHEFIMVVPTLWSTIINVTITMYFFKIESEYPIKLMITFFCVAICAFINITKRKFKKAITAQSKKTIINFHDLESVKIHLSMGHVFDTTFDKNKHKINIDKRNFVNIIMLCFNILIVAYSLLTKNIKQIFIFRNIYWRIAQQSNSINSLEHCDYVDELVTLCTLMEKHKYYTLDTFGDNIITKIMKINFDNASFGYYYDDITSRDVSYDVKINKLSFDFCRGVLYYIESPNGAGKSTLLRMFTMNLNSGDIYFGNEKNHFVNRKNMSFEYISSNVYHVKQSSEYTPNFTKKDIDDIVGRDESLEEQLGLKELLDKDTIEMSGGQKKRMFIYLALISPAQIILFDEVLSELSVDDWIERVASAIIDWKGRRNKIILLVGHGMSKFMLDKNVVSVKLNTYDNITSLIN